MMIARKSALIVATQLANGLLGFIGLKFISKFMQPWEYGIIGFAYGFIAIFSIFGNLGFDAAHIKRISEGKDMGNCIATFFIIKMMLAGFMASAVIFSILAWKYILHRGFESPLHEKAIYIMLSYFVLATLSNAFISTFNARKEIAKSRLPYFAFTLVRIIATIFVAYNDLGPLPLAYTYLLGEIPRFFLAFTFFKGYPIGKPSLQYFKIYFSFARPMAIASAAALIMTNIDKVFIQLFWSATQVGEYFATVNLSRFVVVFGSSISMLLLPTISEHHSIKEMEKIKRLVYQSERYLSMIIFPLIVILIILAKPIIHMLLSDKYMPALPVLQILPLFLLFDSLSRPYQSQLQGMNMPHYTRNMVLIMMIINVILNLILIPKDIKSIGIKLFGMGIKGAAISTVISYFIGMVYIRVIAWKETGVIGGKAIIFHLMAAIIMAASLHELQKFIEIRLWYHLIIASLIGAGIYLLVLIALREFKKEDFKFFIDTINPKKMIVYINDEIRQK